MNINTRLRKTLLLTLISISMASTSTVKAASLSVLDTQQNNCDTDISKGDKQSEGSSSEKINGLNTENIKAIYDFMNGQWGFSGQMVAGILGNWQIESHINPKTVEGIIGRIPTDSELKAAESNSNKGLGLGQWTYDRHTNLVKYAQSHGTEWYTLQIQLEFMGDSSSTGDGSNVNALKKYALSSGDDVSANANQFQMLWERSAGSSNPERGAAAQQIWNYMKSHQMDGKADNSKINQLSNASGNKISASATDKTKQSAADCGSTLNTQSGIPGGKHVSPNGKHGNVIGNWSEDSLPDQLKAALSLKPFKAPDWSTSPYQGGLAGQCTEFTWAYIQQLWSGKAQTIGNGGDLWKTYQNAGAKVTTDPTLGYGMSANDGYAWAVGSAGHTGIVVAVFDEGNFQGHDLKGAFLVEQFNVPPYPAPARKPVFTLVDGTDGAGIHFFSGLGNPIQ